MKGMIFHLECEGVMGISQVEKRVGSSICKVTEAHAFKELDVILQDQSNDPPLFFLPRSTWISEHIPFCCFV